ncbi:MAG: hypothetical protein KAH32_00270, partial [Chlamydiia bacterium]|nr:hypothetical protein [Chlamydiia bacterium]
IFIKNLGDPVFGSMAVLFLIAVIVSFTDDIGSAVFSGIVAYLIFNALQTQFIHSTASGNTGKA